MICIQTFITEILKFLAIAQELGVVERFSFEGRIQHFFSSFNFAHEYNRIYSNHKTAVYLRRVPFVQIDARALSWEFEIL